MPEMFYTLTIEEFGEICRLASAIYASDVAAGIIGIAFDEIRPVY